MTRDPITGRFFKGFTPWNKNLTIEDPRVARNAKNCSTTKLRLSKEGKLPTPWNKNLTKDKDKRVMGVSIALTGIKRRPESIEKSRINAGKKIREQYQTGERKWWGLDPKNKEIWDRIRKNGFGVDSWEDEARKKAFQALNKKPNKLEAFLDDIIQKNFPNEWKYTGNGTMMINRKFPDFTNIDGQKKVILLNGIFWHTKFKKREHLTREQIERLERQPYEEFGYKVLHIWEDELKDINLVLDKIRKYGII